MTIKNSPIAACGRPLPTDPDALLFPAEAASLMALSARTLEGLRLRGGGPAFVRLRRAVRYRRADIIDWIAKRRCLSTSSADQQAR
jgi:predicted DNA-binding transcriptional regulator AlpA